MVVVKGRTDTPRDFWSTRQDYLEWQGDVFTQLHDDEVNDEPHDEGAVLHRAGGVDCRVIEQSASRTSIRSASETPEYRWGSSYPSELDRRRVFDPSRRGSVPRGCTPDPLPELFRRKGSSSATKLPPIKARSSEVLRSGSSSSQASSATTQPSPGARSTPVHDAPTAPPLSPGAKCALPSPERATQGGRGAAPIVLRGSGRGSALARTGLGPRDAPAAGSGAIDVDDALRLLEAQEKALTIRCVQVQEKALAPPRRAPQQEPPRSHSSLGFQPRARRASVAGPPGSALLRGWHDPCALGRWEAARLSPGLDCWESACGGASGAREGLPSALFSAAAIQPCEPGAAGEGARRVRARRASVCAAELSGRGAAPGPPDAESLHAAGGLGRALSSECTAEKQRMLEEQEKARAVRDRMRDFEKARQESRGFARTQAEAEAARRRARRRSSILGEFHERQIVAPELVAAHIAETLAARVGEVEPPPLEVLAEPDNAQVFEEWRQGAPAPPDLCFMVQVTTVDNVTRHALTLTKPWNVLRNADGTVMSSAKRRWVKAGATLRSRFRMGLSPCGDGAREEESEAAGEGEEDLTAGGRGAGHANEPGAAGAWFRQITFKRVNPSGVKAFSDIFVL